MTLEEILYPITSDNVAEAYDFARQCGNHVLVQSLGLESRILTIQEHQGRSPYAYYEFDVLKSDKSSVLEKPSPQRELRINERLFAKTSMVKLKRGKVAWNAWLSVKENFRKMHISTLIYELEEGLYRKWGAVQIQLVALRLGRVVWRRRGFDVPLNETHSLEARYQEWCKDNKLAYVESMNIMKYPDEFLLSGAVSQFSMFKDLV